MNANTMSNLPPKHVFNLNQVDDSWRECLERGMAQMDQLYLKRLYQSADWLPGCQNVFNAFSHPLGDVKYILFGESPYPRIESANGYAFWDACVHELWSESGLNKQVNRATSLRNLIKMLLVASGRLPPHNTTQLAIAEIEKSDLVQTNAELFANFIASGFLLLNATPVLQSRWVSSPQKDARQWRPFIKELLECIVQKKPNVCFIFLGNIATQIDKILTIHPSHKIYAEHPYNVSFITNPTVLNFFRPLQLLEKKQ